MWYESQDGCVFWDITGRPEPTLVYIFNAVFGKCNKIFARKVCGNEPQKKPSIERFAASASSQLLLKEDLPTPTIVSARAELPKKILLSMPSVGFGVLGVCRSEGATTIPSLFGQRQDCIGIPLISHSSLEAIRTEGKEALVFPFCWGLGTTEYQKGVCQDAKESRTGWNMLTLKDKLVNALSIRQGWSQSMSM